MRLFGLIGYPLAQSFSKKYFTEKFSNEGIADAAYELFQLNNISQFPLLLESQKYLCGINVTIPYKQEVMVYLNEIDVEAKEIGAVNCIQIENGKLKGFNTDAPAFEKSLTAIIRPIHNKALVLGTGGAAKAVIYVLNQLGINYQFVSRTKKNGQITYEELTREIMNDHLLIINCTPLGSFPKTDTCPGIPYEYLTRSHCLYDLVYNPPLTAFLKYGQERGATIKNGYDMLVGQAELSWQIWND